MEEKGYPITILPCVGSTNDEMKGMARRGAAHGSVLVALRQTNGRGRLGRSFVSPEKGLYMSVLLRPRCTPEKLPTLTPCAALAVRRALCRICGIEADIKWPNDLLLGGKKLCGILTEAVTMPDGMAAVVGIGVNVNTAQTDFPRELTPIVCSVFSETGRQTDVPALAAAVSEELEKVYVQWETDDPSILSEYRAACVSIGKDCFILRGGAKIPARVLSVSDDFSLTVETGGREERVFFGELCFAGNSMKERDAQNENLHNKEV